MRPRPTLALCIPTYRRPDCLSTLLESVRVQDVHLNEVIVCDDASGDETPDVVARFKDTIPNLLYDKRSINVGLDENFRHCVNLATSDFIWFMGDDDRLRVGAVRAVQDVLEQYPDMIGATLGSVDYDSRLEHATGMRRLPPTHTVAGVADLFSKHLHLLGFMSTMIVSRIGWMRAHGDEVGQFDNLYSQVHRIGQMMGKHGKWVLSDVLAVDYRSDNDQFRLRLGGALPRLKKDVSAYSQIIKGLFATNPKTAFAARDRILRTHVIARVRNAATEGGRTDALATFMYLLREYHRHGYFWRVVAPTIIAPTWLARPVRQAYKRLSSSSGAALARDFEAKSASH